MYSPIRKKVPALLLVFALVMVAGTHLAVEQIRRQTMIGLEQTLSSILFTTHELTRYWVRQHKRVASTPLIREAVSQLLQNPAADRARSAATHQLIARYLHNQVPLLGSMQYALVAPDGRVLSASDSRQLYKTSALVTAQPQRMAASLTGRSQLIPLPGSAPGQRESLWLALPVTDKDGYTLAVLAISGNISERLSELTRWSLFGRSGETYLFDQYATQLTDSRFNQIDLGHAVSHSHNQFPLRLPNEESRGRLTYMASNALAGINSQSLQPYLDYRGVPVLGVWFWNTRLNLGIATEIDAHEALAGYYQSRNLLWGITGLLLVLSTAFTTYIHRQNIRIFKQENSARHYLEEEVKLRTQELNKAQAALQQTNQELEQLAKTDSLTGLANRRHLDSHLEYEWLHCAREGWMLAVILLDIDLFKHYNDCYGHPKGDICLQAVADCLRRLEGAQRPGDLIARYGGEEFMLILSNTDRDYTEQLAMQIRAAIEALALVHPNPVNPECPVVTTSVGAACAYPNPAYSAQELIRIADKALYRAKHQGRNQVVVNPSCNIFEVS